MSKQIHLYGKKAKNRVAIISDCDFEKVSKYKWYLKIDYRLKKSMYVRAYLPNPGTRTRETYLHRFILGDKKGFVIDHINRDTLDNRRENLRHATYLENALNKESTKNNQLGAYAVRKGKKWQAGFNTYSNGNVKYVYIGLFENQDDAIKSSRIRRREMGLVTS